MNSLQMCCILKGCQREMRSICTGDSRRPLKGECKARVQRAVVEPTSKVESLVKVKKRF